MQNYGMKLRIKYSDLVIAVLLFAFVLNFLGELTIGILGVGVLDEVATLIILGIGFLSFFLSKKSTIQRPWFLTYFLILSVIYFLFYRVANLAFFYAYYKLFIFLIFLPILNFLDEKSIQKFFIYFFALVKYVLLINLVFIILQYITDNDILRWLGYKTERTNSYGRLNRFTGLFDVATLGLSALLFLFLNEFCNKGKSNYYWVLILGILSLISSSSKASYLIFILWLIIYFNKYILKHGLKIAALLVVFLFVVYAYTKDVLFVKYKQYSFFVENFSNRSQINLSNVEKRVMFLAESLSIFKENLFGLGLGTFGDAAVNYNPDPYKMSSRYWAERIVNMSDSVYANVIAEQGLTGLLYFGLILVSPLFFITKKAMLKFYVMFVVFYLIMALATMGLSSGTYSIIFALVFGLFYYNHKYEKIFTLT